MFWTSWKNTYTSLTPVRTSNSNIPSAYPPHIPLSRELDGDVDLNEESDGSPLLPHSDSGNRLGGRILVINNTGGTLTVQPSSNRSTDTYSYSYAYGPKGLPGLLHNRYAFLCAFFASIGGLEFGYDQGVIANVLVMKDFMARWPLTPLQKGTMTAFLELGALLGALLAGVYADRYSRGQAIVWACVIFIIGSSFQCFAQQLSHIFIGRAVGGVGVGALSMLSPIYMAEISPPEVRGSLMALEQFSIVLGVVFGFWTGFATREYPSSMSWRLPLGVQLIPAIILALGCTFVLPPSPRLLVLQGKEQEAAKALSVLRGGTTNPDESSMDVLVQLELLEMRAEREVVQRTLARELELEAPIGTKTGFRAEWEAWKKLFSARYRDRTWIGVLIMVFQQWSGINALLYYGPTLIQSIGLRGDTPTLLVSGGIGIVQLFAVVPAIIWIDRVGRRALLRGGSAAMALSHASIGVLVLIFQSKWSAHPFAAWVAVGGIYTFTFAYGLSIGPIGWVLPSEVFPLSMRSKGVALSTMSNWTNNFLIGLLTPVLVDFSASLTFLIFASACVLAYIWATFFVPETANVPLEEIDKLFKAQTGTEEQVLREEIERDIGLYRMLRNLIDDADG